MPCAVNVDNTSVYWLTGTGVVKLDKDSGNLATLATGLLSPTGMVLDETSIFVMSPFGPKGAKVGLFRIAKTGGEPTFLVEKANGDIAVDSTHVYWATFGGKVLGVPKAGGTPKEIYVDPTPRGPSRGLIRRVAAKSGAIYFTYTVGLASSRNGFIQGLASEESVFFYRPPGGGSPAALALDTDNVYWTDFQANINGEGSINKVTKTGTNATTLAKSDSEPTCIAVDGSFVYWGTFGRLGRGVYGAVMRVSKTGGEAKVLATGQDRVSSIAVDDANIYWTTFGGNVVKLAK
jgi:hypothetical protein